MRVTISPSIARGSIMAPPSKSYGHRGLICAALADGVSTLHGIASSQDLLATMDCLRALGTGIEDQNGTVRVTGFDQNNMAHSVILPCRASGSTLRFLIPVALLYDKPISFTGVERLMDRPLSVYETICNTQSLLFKLRSERLDVRGPLSPGLFELPGNISSQFISGLLFALPLLKGDSLIQISTPIESRPYIEMTLAVLHAFGIKAAFEGGSISVPGNQRYMPQEFDVEGDWSNAAFFLALNALDGCVKVHGLRLDSLQGDRVCLQHFSALQDGCPTIDLSNCPDLGPISMALAALLHGAVFTGIRRLRLKESDRCAAMVEELARFGVKCEIYENKMTIHPAALKRPLQPLWSHGDHRIAMALSILATRVGADLDGAEAVAKSIPDFFEQLKMLGIEVQES